LLFVLFQVLFVCKCVLYWCHQVTTQLQLTNISYHIIVTMLWAWCSRVWFPLEPTQLSLLPSIET
jgi:hypothetical protein